MLQKYTCSCGGENSNCFKCDGTGMSEEPARPLFDPQRPKLWKGVDLYRTYFLKNKPLQSSLHNNKRPTHTKPLSDSSISPRELVNCLEDAAADDFSSLSILFTKIIGAKIAIKNLTDFMKIAPGIRKDLEKALLDDLHTRKNLKDISDCLSALHECERKHQRSLAKNNAARNKYQHPFLTEPNNNKNSANPNKKNENSCAQDLAPPKKSGPTKASHPSNSNNIPNSTLHECKICGALAKNMSKHIEKAHSSRKPKENKNLKTQKKVCKSPGAVRCLACQSSFSDMLALQKHINATHGRDTKNKNRPAKYSTKCVGSRDSHDWSSRNETLLDAKREWGSSFRDHGQFGSYPSHDNMDDE